MGRLMLVFAVWAGVMTGPAMAQSQALDVTLLETVNLPWQDPEVIITAKQPLSDVRVTIASGGATRSEAWEALSSGQSRSLLWTAPVGSHQASVKVTGYAGDEPFEYLLDGTLQVREPLEVVFGASDVDLARRQLQLRANAPIQTVEMSLYDVDGRALHQSQVAVPEQPTVARLPLPETPRAIARIDLRVFASDDTWADTSWSPIQVELPPPALSFDGAGAGIALGDRDKLDEVAKQARELADKHAGVKGLKLFVLGASGDAAAKSLTEARARAVARYVKRKGVRLPVAVGTVIDPGFEGIEYIIATHDPAKTLWQPVR